MGMEIIKKLREETGAGILACQKALKEVGDDYDKAVDLLRKQGIAKASSKSDRITSEGLCCVLSNDTAIAIVKLNCETDFVAKNEKFQQLAIKITEVALNNNTTSIDELLNQNIEGKNVKDLIAEGIATIGENIVLGDVKVHKLENGQIVDYYIHNKIEGSDNLGKIVSAIISTGCNNDDAKTLLHNINMHITAMSPIALSEEQIDKDVIAREKSIYEEQVSKLNKPEEIAKKMVEGKLRKFYEESVLLKQMFVMDNKNSVANVIADFNKKNNTNLSLVLFDRISI